MFVLGQREFTWYALLFVSGLLGAYAIAARTMMAEGIDIVYVSWAVVFDRVDSVPRYPVQVYEGLWYIALCLALLLARQRWAPPQGVLSGLFLVGMFLPRFFLEF